MTTDMLREAEEDLRCFTVSASRMLVVPEPEDLFAGEVEIPATRAAEAMATSGAPASVSDPVPPSALASAPPTAPVSPPEIDLDDLME